MKILIANVMDGDARFVVEGFPKTTFCVPLKGKTTIKEITDELIIMYNNKIANAAPPFNPNLRPLEGTDI